MISTKEGAIKAKRDMMRAKREARIQNRSNVRHDIRPEEPVIFIEPIIEPIIVIEEPIILIELIIEEPIIEPIIEEPIIEPIEPLCVIEEEEELQASLLAQTEDIRKLLLLQQTIKRFKPLKKK